MNATGPLPERRGPAGETGEGDALDRLRTLIRIPTVSRPDESLVDWDAFDEFIDVIAELYPRTHEALTLERIDGHTLLFRWAGREPGAESVLMAHYDVVAAEDEGWDHPPFAAELVGTGADRVVWGRGTLDDKGSLVAILEAVEQLVTASYRPLHDVYLSFGHNEETAGSGAPLVVERLNTRGIRPRFVLDEGGAVIDGVFPGVTVPLAVVGVSEKGITSVTLTVKQAGGHAATPPRLPATVRLARAVVRLNAAPFPATFAPTNIRMLRTIGAHASAPLRFAFRHADLLRRPLLTLFSRLSDETNAMIRTTAVVTQLSGSAAGNALAEQAQAVVNTRIAIDSSVEEAIAHIRRAVHDPLVEIEALHPSEPSPVSPADGPAWELLESVTARVYPRAVVTPYVMLGASDSRHFTRISDHVYRFTPFEMSTAERGTLHAANERMRVDTFLSGIRFYRTLLERL